MDSLAALQHGFAPALASALLQSLWQNTLLALAAACTLAAMVRASAAQRHAVAMLFMVAMVVVPSLLFIRFWHLSAEDINRGWLPTMTQFEPIGMPAMYVSESSQLPEVVALLWLLGVTLALLRHAGGLWTVRAMERAPHAQLPVEWQACVLRLRRTMGIVGDVVVHVSHEIVAPCAARLLRPVIWLPVALLARMPADQLEALLAHELAHILRRDWLWNGVQCMLEALLFFHPAAWWLGRRIRQEREHACDDLAVAACGDAIALAEALMALERQRRSAPRLVLNANGGSLMQRITRLLNAPPTRESWITTRIAIVVVMTGGLFVAAQAGSSGSLHPDLRVSSTTQGKPGPGDVREIETSGIDGRRIYRATVDTQGRLVETYKKDGQTRPIDAGVRRWLVEVERLSMPPPPPAPPSPPPAPVSTVLPALPPVPDVKASEDFKALMRLVVASPEIKATLGTPLVVGEDPLNGSISLDNGEGNADLNFTLQGPGGTAHVRLLAEMNHGVWRLQTIDIR